MGLTFTPTAPPSVVVTLTTGAGDLSPLVSWVPTTPAGSQIAWEARIALSGQPASAAVWPTVPTVNSGAATQTVCPPRGDWTNGGSYVAWVRIQQTGGLWSAWTASAAQPISWTPPPAPSSVVAAAGEPPTVTVYGIPAGSSVLTVQMSTGDPVLTLVSPGSTVVALSPLHPYGAARTYRARIEQVIDGVSLPSAWVYSSSVTSTDMKSYLADVDSPSDCIQVGVREDSSHTLVQGVMVSYPLADVTQDAPLPITQKTPPAGWAGGMTLLCRNQAQRDQAIAWLSTRKRWWVRWSPDRDPDTGMVDEPPICMTLADEMQKKRFAQASSTLRGITFDWVQARP